MILDMDLPHSVRAGQPPLEASEAVRRPIVFLLHGIFGTSARWTLGPPDKVSIRSAFFVDLFDEICKILILQNQVETIFFCRVSRPDLIHYFAVFGVYFGWFGIRRLDGQHSGKFLFKKSHKVIGKSQKMTF